MQVCRARGQSGQAVVEYLLVLIVTVAIILGAIYQLNDAFRVWANNYFGNYLACLLEVGELPALGGAGEGDAGVCDEQFQAFSLADGRPPQPSSGGGGGGSGGGSGGSGDSGDGDPASRPSGGSRGGSRSTSTGGGGGSGGGGSRSFSMGRAGNSSELSSRRRSSGPRVRVVESEGVQTFKVRSISSQGSSGLQTEELGRGVYSTGSVSEDGEQRVPVRVGGKKEESGQATPPERLQMRKKLNKTQFNDDIDGGWDLGDWLRFLLIAAILIALIVFIGGQVLQMTRSDE